VGAPAFARFLPRVRALFIDSIILLLVMAAALMIAVAMRSESIARPLGFTVVTFWLLYEPLLVSFAGGTIGHRRTNLRVVDDRTQGNVSFLKAVARTVIKGLLGWVSFVSMLTTRRVQAIHDLVTHSTVQVRDLALAGPSLYVHEREELSDPALPSRMRRMLVIGVYLGLACAIYLLALFGLFLAGVISNACVAYTRCSPRDDSIVTALAGCWGLACVACLWFGWRGRLYGARAR
jgi:uncharacterized RDD family membrane protein YckC